MYIDGIRELIAADICTITDDFVNRLTNVSIFLKCNTFRQFPLTINLLGLLIARNFLVFLLELS